MSGNNVRTGMDQEDIRQALIDNLYYIQGKDTQFATLHDYYIALAYTVRDRLIERRIKTVETQFKQDAKTVYYLSAEFLIGRLTSNNLISLDLYETMRQAVASLGVNLDDVLEGEEEPGLGNGGLGRLAACFMDSLATLEIPAIGYGIRYEFGIFDQIIANGWQHELPDNWLLSGNPWEIARSDYTVEVKFGGKTEAYTDNNGQYRVRWVPRTTVSGMPYDTPVPGYHNNTVNILRLWSAKASEDFNFQVFNAGEYTQAVAAKTYSENISKVLYPNDNTPQGKELRLEQQYFFVSCSLQDIVRQYLVQHDTFDAFPQKAAIQLNDTHPSIGVAELMRLLIDEHAQPWAKAWEITTQTFAYTNHTLLVEALERWSVSLFGRLLPRHLEIIYEINFRFLSDLRLLYPHDDAKIKRLSLIEEGSEQHIRMAHLACVGSHTVNGVAALHTELLKQDVLHDFYELYPEKFQNKTNGVTPRRWLLMSNPQLASLITSKIGDRWVTHLTDLKQLEAYVDQPEFQVQWKAIKQANKRILADYIKEANNIEINVNSLFDVQVKRIHEYKRQLLNVLQIISQYNCIKQMRLEGKSTAHLTPRTYIFGGKAAPGYFIAKLVVKLINSVAEKVNNDPDLQDLVKVVYLANFSVSLGQITYPAADLSEQVSTAGKEASGTGNMKFAMNGALTIGTLDGANVEIREEVGADNFFLFGLTAQEVSSTKQQGYNPMHYYQNNADLRQVIDQIASGFYSPQEPGLFRSLIDSLLYKDEYMLLADYQGYLDCQNQVSQAYQDETSWTRKSILNVARMGKFSSDYTIKQYCDEIWGVKPLPIALESRPAMVPSR